MHRPTAEFSGDLALLRGPAWVATPPFNPFPLTSTMGVSGGFSCLSSFSFLPFLTSLLGSLASSPSISSLGKRAG